MNKLTQKYLNYLKFERNASPHTIISYERDLHDFQLFLQDYDAEALTNPDRITRFTIRAWLGELSENGLKKSSIARKISALRSLFKFAFKRGHTKENPVVFIKRPRLDKILPKSILKDDMIELFDAMPCETVHDIRDKAILELFYATGIRLSELTGLNLSDINTQLSQIRVMGKGSKERIIPVSKTAINAVLAWLDVRHELLPKSVAKKDYGAVFLTNSGKRMYPVAVQRLVKRSIERVSEANTTNPHVLRHSFATHLLNNGADIRVIKELMGHANLSSTQVYTSTSVERLKNIHEHSHPRGKS